MKNYFLLPFGLILGALSPIGFIHSTSIVNHAFFGVGIENVITNGYASSHLNVDRAKDVTDGSDRSLSEESGGLQLPGIYSDHMVLQRDKHLRITGLASAGDKIRLCIGGQKKETYTKANGQWEILLDPLSTGQTYTMEITSPTQKIVFKDVVAGEVWLCSGQSNMAMLLRETAEEEMKAQLTYVNSNSSIRVYDMKPLWNTYPVVWSAGALDSLNRLQYFKKSTWEIADASNIGNFSAIAFAFARMLEDSLKVPVGLVINAVGGSPIESWIDQNTLKSHFPDIFETWPKNAFIDPWVCERALLNIKGALGKKQKHPYEPAFLFDTSIVPLQQYPLCGIIWYQGESNAHDIEAYEKLFPLLVWSWRNHWKEDLPFYYVQLSSMDRPSWPKFRDAQRQLMDRVPNIGMAVSSDRGDSLDVHPKYKKVIGERLARWALAKNYNCKITESGPLVKSAVVNNKNILVEFDYGEGLTSSDGGTIKTFEVAAIDSLFYPATVVIENKMLKVWSDRVEHPCFVRYGWQPYTKANLINGDRLPASTFQIKANTQIFNFSTMNCTNFPNLQKTESTISLGISAPFAAVWNNQLILAGGCNFPDKPVTEGGQKKYYDEIFAINMDDRPPTEWKQIGKLLFPVAYGAAVATRDGVVCIGGNNHRGSFSNVYLLIPLEDSVQIQTLPPLPCTLDNLSAASLNNCVYVVGGNSDGIPSNKFFCMDLSAKDKGWKELSDIPGPSRVQPVLVAQENQVEEVLFLCGGFQPAGNDLPACLPTSMLVYSRSTGVWKEECSLPPLSDGSSRTLTGGAGVAYGDRYIIYIGGVNYDRFLSAIDRPRQIQKAKEEKDESLLTRLQSEALSYMLHPVEWYRFNQDLLVYDTKLKTWNVWGTHEQLARAGAGVVVYRNRLIVINGELKPGVRSAQISSFLLP